MSDMRKESFLLECYSSFTATVAVQRFVAPGIGAGPAKQPAAVLFGVV
jgi:hypothetical protein